MLPVRPVIRPPSSTLARWPLVTLVSMATGGPETPWRNTAKPSCALRLFYTYEIKLLLFLRFFVEFFGFKWLGLDPGGARLSPSALRPPNSLYGGRSKV